MLGERREVAGERRHGCENTGPTARTELTRAHCATLALVPRADEPAACLRDAWIELLGGETPTLSSGAPGESRPAMRPRPRAPRAYSRFPSCHSPPTRARLRLPALPRPADWPPRASPRGPLTSLAPRLRVAGVQAPRGAPGASALASSARVRRPEIVPVRRPAGVGRPPAAGFGGSGWVRAVSAPRSRCSLPHPPPSPAPGVRVPLLARAFRCWSRRCAEAAPLLHSYSTP